MRSVWTGQVPEPFAVRDVRAHMPELAYTTVMTTLRRLADKGLLVADATLGKRAYDYRPAGTPQGFLAAASHREAQDVVDRYGDAALAAFAARLDALTPEQRTRLEELEGR
jgi:predicted transcriptional regulator